MPSKSLYIVRMITKLIKVDFLMSYFSIFKSCTSEFMKLGEIKKENHTYCDSAYTEITNGVCRRLITHIFKLVLLKAQFALVVFNCHQSVQKSILCIFCLFKLEYIPNINLTSGRLSFYQSCFLM